MFVPGILRHWENNLGYAHSAGGMQYENGELIIPLTGRYYVYSQLYFQVEDDRAHMIHFVHLNRTGNQQVIMRSVTSRCRAKKAKLYLYSSYQGAVFELHDGDHILVGVSEGYTKSISMGESASFFGAFLVWNQFKKKLLLYLVAINKLCTVHIHRGVNWSRFREFELSLSILTDVLCVLNSSSTVEEISENWPKHFHTDDVSLQRCSVFIGCCLV